jgi:GntR family transcriptional regulator
MPRGSRQRSPSSEERGAFDGSQLRRTSFVPLYFQLAEILKERIEAGDWPTGGRFLSERQLCREFGVSRTVVRPALSMLEGDGQLTRIKGRGTFVAPMKVVDRIRGLTRSLSEPVPQGIEIRVLEAVEQRPEPQVAEMLGLDRRRDKIAHITSVTRVDGRPLFLSDSFVSLARVPEISAVTAHTTIGPTPRILALALDRSQVAIQTSFCSEFEAEQLEITAGGLVFLIRCVEFAKAGRGGRRRAVEVARVVYPADVVELEADLA